MPIIYYVLAIGLIVWLLLALHVWSRKGGKLRAHGQTQRMHTEEGEEGGRMDSGARERKRETHGATRVRGGGGERPTGAAVRWPSLGAMGSSGGLSFHCIRRAGLDAPTSLAAGRGRHLDSCGIM